MTLFHRSTLETGCADMEGKSIHNEDLTFKIMVSLLLLDFSLTGKAAPHECVIRTSKP